MNWRNITPRMISGGKIPAKSRKNNPSIIRKNRDIPTLIFLSVLFFIH
jgi:hypothetical protein